MHPATRPPAMMRLKQRPRFELCVTLRGKEAEKLEAEVVCVAFAIAADGQLSQLGCSAALKNNAAAPCCQVDFVFEWPQQLRFMVFDVGAFVDDGDGLHTLSERGVIGQTEMCLSEIVGAPGLIVSYPLTQCGHNRRTSDMGGDDSLTIFAKRLRLGAALMRFEGLNLKSKDIFMRKCDAYLVVSRDEGDGEHIPIAKTDTVKGNASPSWRPVSVDVRSLCSGDLDRPVVLQVFDAHKGATGHVRHIGSCSVPFRQLLEGESKTVQLQHPRGKKDNVGSLLIYQPQIQVEPDSFDYMCMSMLHLSVAIDFTASNSTQHRSSSPGAPQESLHTLDSLFPNVYQDVLIEALSAMVPFAQAKVIHTYGFGGRAHLPRVHGPGGWFPLSGDCVYRDVYDTQGVLDAYAIAVATTDLGGSTEFAPIIQEVKNRAARDTEQGNSTSNHHVLLIITDGDVSDVESTMDAVVDASDHAVSILIINVGTTEASRVQSFLTRKAIVASDGRVAARKIVTYVSLRRSPKAAVSAALAALSEQWMQMAESNRGVENSR